jgi:restriction endonuclease Mrr
MAKKRITLSNLIDVGLLKDGEKLECRFTKDGEVYVGRLNADGSISYDSEIFTTPSGWGKHLASKSRESSSSNGWTDVSARGKKLSEYRSLMGQTDSTKTHMQSSKPNNEAEASAFVPEGSKTAPDTFATEREDNTVSTLLERIAELSSSEFEKLVGEFLKAKGFTKVKITNRSHDGGIDGKCELSFIDVKVAFQAKQYKPQNSVGIDPVQRLQGSLQGHYDRGVFVTTSNFTSPAKSWVKEANAQIRLVDGEELVQQMIDLNLGVKTVPVVEHQIDESFFSRLAKE